MLLLLRLTPRRPRQSKIMSISLSAAPESNGSIDLRHRTEGVLLQDPPTSASTASIDKVFRPPGVSTLQTSISLLAREEPLPQISVLLVPTSISQLFAEPIAYVWFDFHHECRKMAWQNLSKLMAEVEEQFTQYGWFECDGEGQLLSRQRGVFRVNCMDNLDRTNVVMSLFARRTVRMALQLYPSSTEIDKGRAGFTYKSFEVVFKNAWADNADLSAAQPPEHDDGGSIGYTRSYQCVTSMRLELPVTTRVRDGVIAAFVLLAVIGYLIIKKGKFRSIGRRYVCKPAFSSSGYIRRKNV
ncbi:unnamed protein product [Peronospora destructor]|uniref:SAC domain-containing protein n=1 Tax=Peronospora destructor TaxID=86335 RepID=A0AAV0UZI4_9STRA|nr:unnamed protein product [Peronospora destructor]